MKKLLILFMAFGLVAVSCNNDKGKGPNDRTNTNRDKDDYNNRDDEDKDNRDNRDDRNNNRDDEEFSSGWSSSDKRQWMEVCRDPLVESMGESRATDYCECIMEKISKKYSSFNKMNTQGTEEEGEALGRECIKELGLQ